jgi:hypothetical protein
MGEVGQIGGTISHGFAYGALVCGALCSATIWLLAPLAHSTIGNNGFYGVAVVGIVLLLCSGFLWVLSNVGSLFAVVAAEVVLTALGLGIVSYVTAKAQNYFDASKQYAAARCQGGKCTTEQQAYVNRYRQQGKEAFWSRARWLGLGASLQFLVIAVLYRTGASAQPADLLLANLKGRLGEVASKCKENCDTVPMITLVTIGAACATLTLSAP